MDISIEKNSDLLDFINSEKSKDPIDINKAYLYFNTCCCKTIIELDKKLKNLNDKCMTQEIVMGTQMFSHVFFVLLSYTNNLKLTIFLAESALRAVKLCQPLRVPSTGYERWKELQLNFDAREMLEG